MSSSPTNVCKVEFCNGLMLMVDGCNESVMVTVDLGMEGMVL